MENEIKEIKNGKYKCPICNIEYDARSDAEYCARCCSDRFYR